MFDGLGQANSQFASLREQHLPIQPKSMEELSKECHLLTMQLQRGLIHQEQMLRSRHCNQPPLRAAIYDILKYRSV